ncbi:MAG: ABC transporter ATP-binding protein [Candidatus Berkelbacteria bacterium]|nr:ABC transporter ATP-binding protein [Candidatus Berkelbacteria bacterium]
MKKVVISVDNVKKRYKLGKIFVDVLRGVDFEIHSTEFVILFGPSGAGKTTLVDLIAGLDLPDSGKIKVRNLTINELPEKELAMYRRRKIGLVFQEFNLVENMTAVENVALPLIFDNFAKSVREKRAVDLLSELGLAHRLNHRPSELSGGEQQRVSIARALVNNPWILLIDEPTGDLDSQNAHEIMELISSLNKKGKRTILLVTHNPDYLHYANRVLQIVDGRIVGEKVIG